MRVTAVIPCSKHDWHSPADALLCVEARRVEIQQDRLNPWHTLILTEGDAKTAHPLDCDLNRCRYWAVAQSWHEAPALPGIYKWTGEPSDLKLEPLG